MKRQGLAFVVVISLAACSGSSGGSHVTGAAGTSGAAGTTGAAGTSGAAGTTGAAGTSGAAGTTGAAGSAAGASGAAGTTGAAGTSGVAGTSGAAGTTGAAGATDAGVSDAGAARVFTGTAKMMVVGSSNEIGTCWRAYLWQDLHTGGITNFDFVGQQSGGPSCTVVGWNDTQLQAMSGIIISNITTDTYKSWFMANPPDVILMHFGGADVLAGMPIDPIMKSFGRALDAARMVNPKVILLIAEHTPEGKDAIVTLNADIAAWAPTVSTADSPVIAVDLYTGMVAADFSDGVHLNQQGSMKVADRWYAALKPFFGK